MRIFIPGNVPSSKICTKCGVEKPLKKFRRDKRGRLGVQSACKACYSIADKLYRTKNIDKTRVYSKQWHQRNREKAISRKKKWNVANKDRIKIANKNWYATNKEKSALINKIWRRANKDKMRGYYKAWYKINNKKVNSSNKNKRQADPMFKLNSNIKRAISTSLKGNKNRRHWETIVGYTLEKLRKHLEKQFQLGMTWENYGEWHLDHKIPIIVFNFTKPEHQDFKKCWTLNNLQPLWAKENLSKGAILKTHFQPSLLI